MKYDKSKWKEKAIENEKKAHELILSIGQEYTKSPESIAELLQFASNFYKYSLNNTQLIYAQNDGATYVQSFESWKKMDAHVKKGETGIKIWVPVKTTMLLPEGEKPISLSMASEEQVAAYQNGTIPSKKVLSFKIGTVFDISQTDFPKEKLPELFSMGYASEDHLKICDGLVKFSESLGCKVFSESIQSIAKRGYYSPSSNTIVLNELLEDTQRLSTLSHEIGHMLEEHGSREVSLVQKEFEADSISILIQSHFGVELTDARKRHLADHYQKFVSEIKENNPSMSQEEIIKAVDSVLEVSMGVFRKYAEQMQEFVDREISSQNKGASLEMDVIKYSFSVYECMEFPDMGEIYANITNAQEALDILKNIPEERKAMLGGICIVGKDSDKKDLEIIPIIQGRSIELGMLDHYPALKNNLVNNMAKNLVDLAKSEGYQSYGSYNFAGNDVIMAANRRNKR